MLVLDHSSNGVFKQFTLTTSTWVHIEFAYWSVCKCDNGKRSYLSSLKKQKCFHWWSTVFIVHVCSCPQLNLAFIFGGVIVRRKSHHSHCTVQNLHPSYTFPVTCSQDCLEVFHKCQVYLNTGHEFLKLVNQINTQGIRYMQRQRMICNSYRGSSYIQTV